MTRLSRSFALAAMLTLLPAVAWAQKEPGHTKETKNAEKFIGLAMTRTEPAEKRQFLEQALPPLREAMQKNPDNGRVWLMSGSVYAGLGQYAAADSAFDRALQLHPPYAEQIDSERHIAWESAFNVAVGFINEQKIDEGIRALEEAELLYDHRPEAKYYLGLFYSQRQEHDKAERALNAAVTAVNGPIRPKLPAASAAEWDRMATNARIRLSNVRAMRGAAMYDTQKFDSAGVLFRHARQMNAASRDHLFNQLQALYARALELDKQRADGKSAALNQQAQTIYSSVLALTDSLRTVDPRNEDIFFFSSRAHKVLSELTTEAAARTKHMNALRAVNTEYEQLPFLVTDIQIAEGDSTATVSGNVQKKRMPAAGSATIVFELLGFDGKPLGSAPITVAVPANTAADAKLPFKAEIPAREPVAGWKYRIQ
ncbi:MAG TPA: hypothetical protein VGD27_19450 [Longimicrobiales bacterium]